MSSLLSPKVPIVDERQPKCSKVYEISCLLVRTSVDSHFTSRKESMSLLISSSYDALFFFLGYSGSDMANLCREAALGPIRSITDIQCIDADQVWIKPSSVLTWMVPCPILHHPSSSCIAFYRAYSHFMYTKSSLAYAHAQYRLHSDRQRTILNMCYELGMKNNLSPPRGFKS